MRFRFLAAILILLTAAYGWYWRQAAQRFEARIGQWSANLPPGLGLDYRAVDVGGFPFRLAARLDDAVLSGQAPSVDGVAAHGWRLSAAEAHLTTLLWKTQHWVMSAPNARLVGHIDWPAGADGTGNRHQLEAQAQTLRASLRLRPNGAIARLSVDLLDVSGAAPSLLGGGFTAKDLQVHLRQPQAAAASADADALLLPEQLEAVLKGRALTFQDLAPRRLGREIAKFTLVVAVDAQSLPRHDAAALAQWRDAGGTLAIKLAAIDWGPLSVEGEGDLALDDRFQPIGAMSLRGQGFAVALSDLVVAGAVAPETAEIAGLALAALVTEGQNRQEIPLSAQDGHLYLGPVPLLPVAPMIAP